MTPYPFVKAGTPDYGPRKGPTLGIVYHMAEGGGTVAYLSKTPARGVSVHAVCEYSGQVVQMLAWDRASGSLNPRDRSTDKAYFGQTHLMDVLGSWWTDPNSAVLSMELEGFAAKGPSHAQVDAAIAWGLDMKGQFSSLRGALGHADQTNTKRCPGTTLAMQLIFEGVGGHGLWHPTGGPSQGDDMRFISAIGYGVDSGKRLAVPAGTPWRTLDGKATGAFGAAADLTVLGLVDAHSGQYAVLLNTADPDIYADGVTRPTIVLVSSARQPTDAPPPPAVDCTAAIDAATRPLKDTIADREDRLRRSSIITTI